MATEDVALEPVELSGEQVAQQVEFANAIGVRRPAGGVWEPTDFADPPADVSVEEALQPSVLWVALSEAQIRNTWVSQYLKKVSAVFKKFAEQPGGTPSKPSPAIPGKAMRDWIKYNTAAPDVVKAHGSVPTDTPAHIDRLRNRIAVNAFNAAVADFGDNDWFDDPL